jgi:tetrahydrodipicolinate N-succinyltransferase
VGALACLTWTKVREAEVTVRIGSGCKIQDNVSIYTGVEFEQAVFCGPSCVFTNVTLARRLSGNRNFAARSSKGVTIGANSTIVCGHVLGEYSFIAAGAIITRDVPSYALMMRVPASRVGWMSRAGIRLGADLVCPIEGVQYQEGIQSLSRARRLIFLCSARTGSRGYIEAASRTWSRAG